MDLSGVLAGIGISTVAFVSAGAFFLKLLQQQTAHLQRTLERDMDRLRTDLAALATRPQPPLTRLHEKKADLMAQLYLMLASLHRHLNEVFLLQSSGGQLYIGGRKGSEREIEMKLRTEQTAALNESLELDAFMANNRIYFEPALIEAMKETLAALKFLATGPVEIAGSGSKHDEPLKETVQHLTSSMRALEDHFRTLLGDESRPSLPRHTA